MTDSCKLPVSDYLCEVDLIYDHDHPVDSVHSLSLHNVTGLEETKVIFQPFANHILGYLIIATGHLVKN